MEGIEDGPITKSRPSLPKRGMKLLNEHQQMHESHLKRKRSELFITLQQEEKRFQKRKALSTGIWKEDKKVVELNVSKGKAFQYVGYSEKSKHFLNIEEALFLIDTCDLEVLRNEVPMSLQELFILLGSDGLQNALECYTVYCYLKRLGYVVLRTTNINFTLADQQTSKESVKQPKPKKEDPKSKEDSKSNENSNEKKKIEKKSNDEKDKKPNEKGRKRENSNNNTNNDNNNNNNSNSNEGERKNFNKRAKFERNTATTTTSTTLDQNSKSRGWYEPSDSIDSMMDLDSGNVVVEETPRFHSVTNYSELSIFKQIDPSTIKPASKSRYSVTFDMYLSQDFKRSNRSTIIPPWRVVVLTGLDDFPSLVEIKRLINESGPSTIVLALVSNGSINFFHLTFAH